MHISHETKARANRLGVLVPGRHYFANDNSQQGQSTIPAELPNGAPLSQIVEERRVPTRGPGRIFVAEYCGTARAISGKLVGR